MSKRIYVEIYCDSTGLFSEAECNYDNICGMLFDEDIVRKWYHENGNDEWEGDEDIDDPYNSFEEWLKLAYTCDDVDGLYWFAIDNGDIPTFCVDGKFKVNCYDEDGETVFTGTFDECREFGRDHDWVWGEDEDELVVIEEE